MIQRHLTMPPKRKSTRRSDKVRPMPGRSRSRSQPYVAEPPLQQGLVEMATIGAQSFLWLFFVVAGMAAVAVLAFVVWSMRPVPVYLSERVKAGSPFDVEFWVENSSSWFALPHLGISCVLSYSGAPDLPPTPASDVRLPAGDPTGLGPGGTATFKCPFPAALRGTDEVAIATRAEIYFRIEYDMPVFGTFRLTDNRGPFVLNTKLLPPRWAAGPAR
jgi:hypothetical protein